MTLDAMAYLPVLRGRQSEVAAALSGPRSSAIMPFFELQEAAPAGVDPAMGLPRRVRSAATDAACFLDEVARLWSGPLYVDIGRVAVSPGARTQWWSLLALLNVVASAKVDIVPVIDLRDDTTSRTAARAVATGGRAALRLPVARVRANPRMLVGLVPVIAADLGLPARDVDVILDWSDELSTRSSDDLEADTRTVLHALGGDHGEIVVAGTRDARAFVRVGA
ncbi:MAG: hypothetical protein QM572_11375 [Nocardioides sp.]|uniref:beta family protein n=1 Tax=Nocardioides sp. TaxID=35761 RepID=UPI0039E6DBCF